VCYKQSRLSIEMWLKFLLYVLAQLALWDHHACLSVCPLYTFQHIHMVQISYYHMEDRSCLITRMQDRIRIQAQLINLLKMWQSANTLELKMTAFWDVAPCSVVHSATSQNTVIFILVAVRTWNLTYFESNYIHDAVKNRLNSGYDCYPSVKDLIFVPSIWKHNG
jgi:hypothetical protein